MRIAGIDPGLNGAIAWFDSGRLAGVDDLPTIEVRKGRRRIDANALATLVRNIAPAHCYLEDVHSMPGDGKVQAFSFGRTAGVIEGVLAALKVPVTPCPPAQWKLALRVPAGKDGARARATQLLPGHSTLWQRKKDDGRAEAAMIGLYGLRSVRLANDLVDW
jgi:crossover junction endodeoxyribonuclease RuvC